MKQDLNIEINDGVEIHDGCSFILNNEVWYARSNQVR